MSVFLHGLGAKNFRGIDDEYQLAAGLNRNLAILIDSDKAKPRDPINATKRRIVQEFADHGGLAWVTQGREIENYVPHHMLQKAVSQTHSAYARAGSGGKYDHSLHYYRTSVSSRRAGLLEKSIDKVKVARKVAELDADLSPHDLRKRMTELAKMIRRANGIG